MAAARNLKYTREEVLSQHDIFVSGADSKEVSKTEDLERALQKFFGDKKEFLQMGVEQMSALLELSRSPLDSRATSILCSGLNAVKVFKSESKLWLKNIYRRIGGRRSVRQPYHGQITRDIPYEMFALLCKVVKNLQGFTQPFCYQSNNKKGEVISFTSVRLVNELLALLSGLSGQDVASYFKRNLAGARQGHKVSVIVSDVKDFAFVYKLRQGKLIIAFQYGEWNNNGFPQHSS